LAGENEFRYSRQLMLKEIGAEGQEKLHKSKVLVIGAGGLGSPALYYLAAAGVGKIGTVDFDEVSISNLQRQILYSVEDLHRKKVDVAKGKLERLNPDVSVEKHCLRIDGENIVNIIKDYDVVIDAVDNLETRYLINEGCYSLGKPLVEGAVSEFTGILTTVIPGKTPCYRCFSPGPEERAPNKRPVKGIIGMIPGTIGSLEALEAVKLILGIGDILAGRLLVFDGLDMSFREIKLARNPQCPVCGKNPVDV
jgi:adenylyltransferase/sulfurtransferase